jgi:uncharacterized cupin superfamily protein
MLGTTMLKKHADMQRQPLAACHDGQGALDWTNVLAAADLGGRRLNFLHDDILGPGVSIGVHSHTHDEEYYYVICGRGTMTLDGERVPVVAGDITAVFPGGLHGLENDTDEDLRIIVISVS